VIRQFMGVGLERPTEALYFFGVRGVPAGLVRDFETDVGRDLSEEVRVGRIVFSEYASDADTQLDRIVGPVVRLSTRFDLIRLIGVVGWNSPAFPYPEDFLWYESRLTDAVSSLPVVLLCAYDLLRFPARAIVYGGIETHPLLLSGGDLTTNPQYISADRYFGRLLTLPWLGESS
jgi:hypothetical protein